MTTELLSIKNKMSAMEVEIAKMKGDIDMIKPDLAFRPLKAARVSLLSVPTCRASQS